MKIHEVKCDYCGKQEPLKYNGEHWLMPPEWVELYDDQKARTLNEHICPKCRPKAKKSKEK